MQNEATKPQFSNKNKKPDDFTMKQQNSAGNQRRELEKTSWVQSSSVRGTHIGESLGEMEHKSFDQFKNKRSTFNEHQYNTP